MINVTPQQLQPAMATGAEPSEAWSDAVKTLHDVMAAVPCASLYSLAEAVLEAGYAPAAPAQQPVAYVDQQALINFQQARANGFTRGPINREWMWANPSPGLSPVYAGPPRSALACRWRRDEDTGAFETECGSTWQLSDSASPSEHGQFFCHHCGKPIGEPTR